MKTFDNIFIDYYILYNRYIDNRYIDYYISYIIQLLEYNFARSLVT